MNKPSDRTDTKARGEYTGDASGLRLATLRVGLLNIVTLGLYRIWGSLQVLRLQVRSVSIEGEHFKDSPDTNDKLVGFFSVLLVWGTAFVLSSRTSDVVSQCLGSESSMGLGSVVAIGIVVTLAPVIFVLTYSRYKTVVGGVSLKETTASVTSGALGYFVRGVGLSILTALSLGLLIPYQTFWMRKYLLDRTRLDNTALGLSGRWPDVYPAMLHIGIAAVLALFVYAIVQITGVRELSVLGVVPGIWALWGWCYYRTVSRITLVGLTTIGPRMKFIMRPPIFRHALVQTGGNFLALLMLVLLVASVHGLGVLQMCGATSAPVWLVTLTLFPVSIIGLEIVALLYQLTVRNPVFVYETGNLSVVHAEK